MTEVNSQHSVLSLAALQRQPDLARLALSSCRKVVLWYTQLATLAVALV